MKEHLVSDQRAAYRLWLGALARWAIAGKPGRESKERKAVESALIWMCSVENKILTTTGQLRYPPEGEE